MSDEEFIAYWQRLIFSTREEGEGIDDDGRGLDDDDADDLWTASD